MIKFRYVSKEEMFLIDTTVYWFELLDHKGVTFDDIGASIKGELSYESIFEKPSNYVMTNKNGYEIKVTNKDYSMALAAINEQCKAIAQLEWLVKYFRGCLEFPINKLFANTYMTAIKGNTSTEQLKNQRRTMEHAVFNSNQFREIYDLKTTFKHFDMFVKLLIDNFGV